MSQFEKMDEPKETLKHRNLEIKKKLGDWEIRENRAFYLSHFENFDDSFLRP